MLRYCHSKFKNMKGINRIINCMFLSKKVLILFSQKNKVINFIYINRYAINMFLLVKCMPQETIYNLIYAFI